MLISFLSLGSPSTYLFAEISSTTLPTGGNVVSGNITISTPEVGKMNVDQTSNQGIINWNTFNVGSSASVHFNQPSVKSSILNNVLSGTSIIHGSIFSNGRLILVNPTGILTGPTSAIRAEGAILSTLNITNNNFLNNNFNFSTNSASSITTKGNINSEYVALISPEISNKGKITTNVATALAAGDDVRLSISDSNLLTVAVNPSKLKTSIKNEGNIKTQNGIVTLKTDVAQSVVDEIVKTDDAKAKGLVTENGVVKLVTNTGTIEAKDIKIDAGSKGSSEISGKLNSNSNTSNGGTIEVTAKDIDVNAATISADGKTGGGKVLIGGDWQGSGDLLQATYLNIDDATKISADALISGSGGTIVAWSNIKDENSLTKVSGTLSAKGIDGDGGQIETSGATLLYDNIKVNTSSKSGAYGNWLLDPTNLTIGSSEASTHASSLETTNVTLTADETITVNNTIAYTGSRNSTLTFDATTTVLNANITSSNGTLSVDINTILEAGASNTQITTNGGDVDISGVIRATGASKNLTIDAGAGNVTFSSAVTGVSSTTAGSAGFRRYNIDGYFNDYLDHFDGCETVSCGTVDYVIQEGDEGSTYSRRWTGVLEAEVSATYTFKTRSDDASYAFIGDKDQDLATFIAHIQDGSRYGNDRTSYRVVDNRGTHGQRDRTGTKALVTGGYYPIIVFFGENAGGAGVQFTFKGGGDNTYRYSNSANSNGKLNFYQSTATTNTFINNMTITASAFNAAAIEVGGTLSVTNSGTSAITGAITGDTALTKAGAGELTVSGSNTFTGDTTLSAGTLFGGADGGTKDSFGTGAVTVANGATLKIDDVTNGALTNALTLNGGTLYSKGDSTSYYDGNITLGDHSTFRNDNNLFIDGVISGSSKNLVKTGTGTLNLRGTNTYTGSTTIWNKYFHWSSSTYWRS